MISFRTKVTTAVGNGGRSPLVIASRTSAIDPEQTIIVSRGGGSNALQCADGQVLRAGRCVPVNRVVISRGTSR